MTLLVGGGVGDFSALCSYSAAIRAWSAIEGSGSNSADVGDVGCRGEEPVSLGLPLLKRGTSSSASWSWSWSCSAADDCWESPLLEYNDSMIRRASSSFTAVDSSLSEKATLLLSPFSAPNFGRSRARCEVVAGGVVVGVADLRLSLSDMELAWAGKESPWLGSGVPSNPSCE